ncbi:MAG: hypothetical protein IKD69_16370 [Solobacterium sp.]|nr:hypothetical protein [Solobacterium sp.]
MTTVHESVCTCPVCGCQFQSYVMTSTNAFGSPDLDTRPPEMERSTMAYWLHECPDCGYVFADEKKAEADRKWLDSDEYRSDDDLVFASGLARRFYRSYKIAMHNRKTERAFFQLLHCVWQCDDDNNNDTARQIRIMTADLAGKLIQKKPGKAETMQLIRADLLRRSGRFEQLLKEYENVTFASAPLDNILAFQKQLAEKQDDSCHLIREAVTK